MQDGKQFNAAQKASTLDRSFFSTKSGDQQPLLQPRKNSGLSLLKQSSRSPDPLNESNVFKKRIADSVVSRLNVHHGSEENYASKGALKFGQNISNGRDDIWKLHNTSPDKQKTSGTPLRE